MLDAVLKEFGKGLHDLCQPLTTLQCRLYLGSLDQNSPETIPQALGDCERLIQLVHQLQSRLETLKSQNKKLLIGDTT